MLINSENLNVMPTKEPLIERQLMLYKDKSKNIFANNKIISFSPHNCLTTSPSETDTINIHVDKVIYMFFSVLLQKEYGLCTR